MKVKLKCKCGEVEYFKVDGIKRARYLKKIGTYVCRNCSFRRYLNIPWTKLYR